MLMVELVANVLMLTLALIGSALFLNRIMQALVERSFARVARIESRDLDEQLRGFSE